MSLNHVTITNASTKIKIPVTPNNYKELLQRYFGLDVKIPKLEK